MGQRRQTPIRSRDVLVGVKEIAEFMQCSTGTIHRWIKQLGFPVIEDRHKYFTTKQAIIMWVMALAKPSDVYPAGGIPLFTYKEEKDGTCVVIWQLNGGRTERFQRRWQRRLKAEKAHSR
jgi:hypothetical protein